MLISWHTFGSSVCGGRLGAQNNYLYQLQFVSCILNSLACDLIAPMNGQ